MSARRRPVLITGARAPVAIDLARAFAAAGHPVRLADSVSAHAARWSHVGRSGVLPLPAARHRFDDYRLTLRGLIAAQPDLLIVPTCEEVFFVAEAARRDGFADNLLAPDPALLRQLHSKITFPAFARGLGIEAPPTEAVANAADLARQISRAGEWVFKPEFSRFGTATLIRPTARTLAQLAPTPDERWAAQPFVDGEEICLWSALRAGRLVAATAYRPRWRVRRSASYAFEAFDCPAALDVARRIGEATGSSGQISFDLMLTPAGTVVPIECNPRAVSGLHLFDGDPALARALTGEGPPAIVTRGLRYLAPAMATLGVAQALRRPRAFVADVVRGRDVLTRPGDRLPALGALLDAARFACIGLAARRGATRQTTDDIEWNGEPIQ
jgi:hypothetical protein